MSRDLKHINHEAFSRDVQSSTLPSSDDVNELTNYFNGEMSTIIDKHAPLRQRQVSRRKPAPWISSKVKEIKRQRRRAERKWRKTKLHVHRQLYQLKNFEFQEVIANEKRSYCISKIKECKTSKALYSITNELSGKTFDTVLPNNIAKENLPDEFCKFFNEKIEKIRKDLDIYNKAPIFVPYTGQFMTTFTPVSEDFVKDIIMSSNTKSCDLDPMPTEMLKQNIDFLIKPITHIINTSLKKGIVPVEFKKAILSPLIKKANLDQNSLRNYRPVSNLAFLSKILEKVVRSQLKDHLNENQLHELFQSAYKENHSTETAMLKILNDLLNSADKGEITILSLLDLSAAFDTIDHDIMLTRLSTSFGIEGVALQWFKSYLTGRTFSITIDDVSSSQYTLKFGVPQGLYWAQSSTPCTHNHWEML